jgi:RecJ-like exonuclease
MRVFHYFYKEYKSGKKVRISKEKYLKLKKNKTTSKKIIIKQKGGERPCIVCKRQGQITNLDEKSFFKTTPVKHRCRICEMRYDNENEKKKASILR